MRCAVLSRALPAVLRRNELVRGAQADPGCQRSTRIGRASGACPGTCACRPTDAYAAVAISAAELEGCFQVIMEGLCDSRLRERSNDLQPANVAVVQASSGLGVALPETGRRASKGRLRQPPAIGVHQVSQALGQQGHPGWIAPKRPGQCSLAQSTPSGGWKSRAKAARAVPPSTRALTPRRSQRQLGPGASGCVLYSARRLRERRVVAH